MQKSINGLSPGSTYVIQVASIDGQGQSYWSPTLEITIPRPVLTPNPPTNVTATGNPDNIKISWTQATLNTDNTSLAQPAYYQVYQSLTSTVDTNGTPVGKTSGASFTYLTTMYDTNQYFNVVAVDGFENKSTASTLVTSKVGQPAVMSGLIAKIYSYNRSATGGTVAFTTVSPHGVTGGDKVYIYGSYGGTGATGVDTIFGAPATVISSPLPTSTGFSAVNSLTGNIVNISPSSGTILSAAGNGASVSYITSSAPRVGELVTISGVIPNQYNLKDAVVISTPGFGFSVASAATGTYVSGGTYTGTTPAYMYPSDNAVRVKSDGITVGNMSTGFIVGISPTSFNMQSSSSSTRLAITSNEIAMYKGGGQSVSIKSDGSFLIQSVTGGTALQKIMIDPSGLKLYNSSGANTVNLDSSNGDAFLAGSFKNALTGQRVEIDKTDKNRISLYSTGMTSYAETTGQVYLDNTPRTINTATGMTGFTTSAGAATIETSSGTQTFYYTSAVVAGASTRFNGATGPSVTAATGAMITNDIPATIDIVDDGFWEGRLDINSGVPLNVGGTLGSASIIMLPETFTTPAQILMSPIKVNNTYAVAVGGVGTTTSGSALVVSHGITTYTPTTVVTSIRSSAYSATRHNHVYSSLTGSTNFIVYATTTSADGSTTSSAAVAFSWMVV